MATDKKSFLLYADVIHTVDLLTDEQAGELFKHLLAYVNDKNPDTPDPLIKIAFEPIKQSLKRDLKKYESIREKRSKAGKASAEARAEEATKPTSVEIVKQEASNPTVNDSENVSVSGSDNILSEYSEKDFLEDWGKCRKTYRNLPTNIPRLEPFEVINFNKHKKDYSRDQFREAMRGLFMQEVIKFSSMITRPTHFLENVGKYYNAFISKDFKQYGSKQVQH